MVDVGLIAGRGILPSIWADEARKNGVKVLAVQLIEEADYPLEGIVDRVEKINTGCLFQIIDIFKRKGIDKVVMLGKVDKSLLFNDNFEIDSSFSELLSELPELNDDDIMLAFVKKFAEEGIEILRQDIYLENLKVSGGLLTEIEPDEQLLSEMNYAFKIAREIGRLDIGQTVMVKNNAVLAVEAIEGTDKTIQRAGRIAGPGAVMAKVSKPQQDFRFDIPTVGMTTINNLIDIKARGLVIEADRTFVLDRENLLKRAEANNLVIRAVDSAQLE